MPNYYKNALINQSKTTEPYVQQISGLLGVPLGGKQVVEVYNRHQFVYVRLRSNQNELIQAFNDKVTPSYGLPVLVRWQGNRYVIVGRDTLRYSDWGDFAPYLPRHAPTHEWGGSDVVFVDRQQFLPLLAFPSGSDTGPNILINEYVWETGSGSFTFIPTQSSPDLTVWNPSGSNAVMVLAYLDTNDGLVKYKVGSGSYFSSLLTGTADVLPYIPPPSSTQLAIAGIRLMSGTQVIGWDEIYDVRQFFGGGGGGGGGSSGGTGTVKVQDEGVPLGAANTFNFVGLGVVAWVSGGIATVDIGSGPSGSDSTYLRLDAANSPVYGPLEVNVSPAIGGIGALTLNGVQDSVSYLLDEKVYTSEEGIRIRAYGDPSVSNSTIEIIQQYTDAMALDITQSISGSADYSQPGIYVERLSAAGVGKFQEAIILLYDPNNNPAGVLRAQGSSHADRLWLNPGAGLVNGETNYLFDTYSAVVSGTKIAQFKSHGSGIFWVGPNGELESQSYVNIPAGQTYNVAGSPHTHTGTVGPQGPQGPTGATGPQGPAGPAGGGAGGLVLWDEGIFQGTGSIINFRGDAVFSTISGTVIDVFVTGMGSQGPAGPSGSPGSQGPAGPSGSPGSPGAQGPAGAGNPGLMALDEGVPLGTGTSINFEGAGVTATLSGTVINVNVPAGGAGALTFIAQITPSGSPTGTFSSIPSSYSHLRIVFAMRSTVAATFAIPSVYYNQDYTATHYQSTLDFGYGAGTAGAAGGNFAQIGGIADGANSPADSYSMGEITIPFYTIGAFNREAFSVGAHRRDASSVFMLSYNWAEEWFSKQAINRIDIILDTGNFVTGTIISLYGVS